ncbi:MAG: hypothetical protein ACTSR8_13725 [Promethearchaeota archaeon]
MLLNNPPSNPHWIFTLDWILIDIYIILLLIVFLITVKIFKYTNRWRSSTSSFSLQSIILTQDSCKIRITTNKNVDDKLFSIIIIVTRTKKKLASVLSEGLASYGYKIIMIQIKKESNLEYNLLKQRIKDFELQEYILINFNKKFVPNSFLFNNNKNLLSLLINNSIDLSVLESSNQIISIDSEKIFLFRKRKRKIENNKNNLIISDATNSFKFYETILFGKILEILNRNLIKTSNNF